MSADATLWWALRIAFPLALLLRWRIRWRYPCFSIYLLVGSISAWLDDDQGINWYWLVDTPVVLAKVAAAVEAVSGLLWAEMPERKKWFFVLLAGLVLSGAAITMRVFGWHDVWVIRRSARLMIHTGLAVALTLGMLYGRLTAMVAAPWAWRHMILLAMLFWLHVAAALYRDDFSAAAIVFRLGLLVLLAAWMYEGFDSREPALYRR